MTEKMYVVVRGDLSAGDQIAQACHAVAAFADSQSRAFTRWKHGANNIVVLAAMDVVDLDFLACNIEAEGLAVVRVNEPDLGDELTAIACREGARPLLRKYSLALKGYSAP